MSSTSKVLPAAAAFLLYPLFSLEFSPLLSLVLTVWMVGLSMDMLSTRLFVNSGFLSEEANVFYRALIPKVGFTAASVAMFLFVEVPLFGLVAGITWTILPFLAPIAPWVMDARVTTAIAAPAVLFALANIHAAVHNLRSLTVPSA